MLHANSYLKKMPCLKNLAGLRDLVDFLPASLATIVSYFFAEITRGIWKPVSMNGTDWPSPAANLLLMESEIQEILASAGVNAPSCRPGTLPPFLSNHFLRLDPYSKRKH